MKALSLSLVLRIALAAALYLAVAWLVDNSYYRLILAIIPIWATMALSWNVLASCGYISFGHAAFFGIGAFTTALLFGRFGVSPWFGIAVGIIIGAMAGAAIGLIVFRLKGHYFGLAMLAFPLVALHVMEWAGFQEVSLPLIREHGYLYMQFENSWGYVATAVGLLLAALGVSLGMERSRFGLASMAIRQDEAAAEAAGIRAKQHKMIALTVSAAMAAAAGGVYAVVLLVVTPGSVFGLLASAQALIFGMFGGIGIVWGPILGAALLVPLSEILHAELGGMLPGIQGVVFGLAIIAVPLAAPEGLFWALWSWIRKRSNHPTSAPVAFDVNPADAQGIPAIGIARAGKPEAGRPLLSIRELDKRFGGVHAVNAVELDLPLHSIIGVIGPNGAGKTTLFNLISGFVRPGSGKIVLGDCDITGLPPSEIARRGIGRTFQIPRVFQRLPVLENVMAGALQCSRSLADAENRAIAAIRAVGLEQSAARMGNELTNCEIRLVELARAIAGGARILLLDETLAGLGRDDIEFMIGVIQKLRADGYSILIIEHTMHAMVRLADHIVVLDFGKVCAHGAPQSVLSDPKVIEAYLGKKWSANAAA